MLDESGFATAALRRIVGYEGTPTAFIQLLSAMERDGEILRQVRGRRTYRIAAAGPETLREPATGEPSTSLDLDYPRLARALLQELGVVANGMGAAAPDEDRSGDGGLGPAERNAYAQRIEEARRRLEALLQAQAATRATVTTDTRD